jgi:toxin ParE1/3/4
MTAQFRLTKPAMQDIEEIADRIAQESGLKKSEDFLNQLESKFSKLVIFPHLGRKRDEILPNIRSIPFDNYLVLYMPIGDDLEILRVVSGYRDLGALFANSEE